MSNRNRLGKVTPAEVLYHEGDSHSFLERFQSLMNQTAEARIPTRDLCENLFAYIADDRNLHAAWQHLRLVGGQAAGRDGKTYSAFSPPEMRDEVRALRDELHAGSYTPGPGRRVLKPKASRAGFRPIVLLNIRDRVVQRAAVQILQPQLDPGFDPRSFGGRPLRGVRQALAVAHVLTRTQDRHLWILQDFQDAFEHVPHSRLLQALESRLPAPRVITLVKRMIGEEREAGLQQGGPLSTLLMNFFSDHVLDRPWRKQLPNVPMIRFLDDLLIPCRNLEEVNQARELLQQLCTSCSMKLKHESPKDLIDLGSGQVAPWLGHEIAMSGGDLVYAGPIGRRGLGGWYDQFADRLRLMHETNKSPMRAWQAFNQAVGDLGPCYPNTDRRAVYDALRVAAGEGGFEELPGFDDWDPRWLAAHQRWQIALDFAYQQQRASELQPRRKGRKPNAKQETCDANQRIVYAAGKCGPDGECAWVFEVVDSRGNYVRRKTDKCRGLSRKQIDLTATINALESFEIATRVELRTTSKYIYEGLSQHLARSKRSGWQHKHSKRTAPLKTLDLWQSLEKISRRLKLTLTLIPGMLEPQQRGDDRKL